MKKVLYAIAALACLTVAPSLTGPANAQVSLDLGRDGPAIRLGPDRDMDRDRSRRHDRSDRDDCREVTERTRNPDGSTSVTTTRRCD